MKKVQSENQIARDLDLPTLIDMVFLLLIFFVVVLSPSMGIRGKDPINPIIRNLPTAKFEKASSVREELKTLTFIIERSEESGGQLIFYALNPDSLRGNESKILSIKEALRIAKGLDSYSAPLSDIRMVNALISNHIDAYRRIHFTSESHDSEVEILADESTPFGIINEIFRQCQEVTEGDQVVLPMISKVIFHVTAGQ